MRALITGSEGFVGGYLAKFLRDQGMHVYGFDIKEGDDLRDYEAVRRIIDEVRPDKIFHVGALAYVPESFLDPRRAIDTNIVGSLNILEAVRNIGLKAKIHFCGSSEEYGDAPGPITEESLPNPLSPYAISKLGMDYFGQLYAKSYGMNVVVTRTFNHTGPGRGEQYAESAFAKQIVEIERGQRDKLRHGDLKAIRNYTDVRDIVRAYSLAIDLPSGIYNISSKQNATMQEVLDYLISCSDVEVKTELDTNLLRPADFSFSEPNCGKFKELTGWEPKIKLHQTLGEILEYWRGRP